MKNLFTACLTMVTLLAFSQKNEAVKDKNLPEGNKAFESNNYTQAEEQYRISGSNAPGVAKSSYNLGNAIYRQNKPAESVYAYAEAAKVAKTKDEKHKVFHNLGNAFMEMKNYQDAVEAYKNALRNNPADDQTRYNYALAKDMLKKNPPKQQPPPPKDDKKDNKGGGDKDQKPNQKNDKDKGDNKDKKDKGDSKDKNDQNKDKGDQKDKDKGDGKDKKDQGQPEPKGGSPDTDRMERMLDAINNQEKNVQDKINARKVQGQKRPTEKDW